MVHTFIRYVSIPSTPQVQNHWTPETSKPENTGPFPKFLSTLSPMSSLSKSLVVNSTEVSLLWSLLYRFHCLYQGIYCFMLELLQTFGWTYNLLISVPFNLLSRLATILIFLNPPCNYIITLSIIYSSSFFLPDFLFNRCSVSVVLTFPRCSPLPWPPQSPQSKECIYPSGFQNPL